MLPFCVVFCSGLSLHDQVVFAFKKTCVAGQLRPGDPFPSVLTLSEELRINPNTAHKAVATLVGEGPLEARPGIGSTVARAPAAARAQRPTLLREEAERLVVEARKLSLDVSEVLEAVKAHWSRYDRRA